MSVAQAWLEDLELALGLDSRVCTPSVVWGSHLSPLERKECALSQAQSQRQRRPWRSSGFSSVVTPLYVTSPQLETCLWEKQQAPLAMSLFF